MVPRTIGRRGRLAPSVDLSPLKDRTLPKIIVKPAQRKSVSKPTNGHAFAGKSARNGNGKANGSPQLPAEELLHDDAFEMDAPLVDDDLPAPTDEDLDEEYDVAHTGDDDQIDDPVRIYLMQMGEIPLLNRARGDWRPPSGSSAAGGGSATACWPPTTCCRRPSACWKTSATASCGWTARSRSR